MKKLLLAAAGAIALSNSGVAQTIPPGNQMLFGLTFFKNELITINPTTGEGTLVQNASETISGYGLATYQERLFTFNPNTNTLDQLSTIDGQVVQRTDIGVSGLRGEGDLAIRSDTGMAYLASAFDSDGNPTHPLYTFNVNLGVASVKLTNTPVALDGLAFDSESNALCHRARRFRHERSSSSGRDALHRRSTNGRADGSGLVRRAAE